LDILTKILLWAVPVVLAITVHEVAHGMVANYFGDNTAKRLGRLSLNPLRHIDPIGSIAVPGVLMLIGGIVFGWARAVPVNASQLTHPKRDMALVAFAGPFSNLLMALCWALLMKLGLWLATAEVSVGVYLITMGAAGVFINTALMMINLLPFPPLDGGRILAYLLPDYGSKLLDKLEPFGFPILIVLILTGLLGKVVWPLMMFGMASVTHLTGLPVGLLRSSLGLLF